MTQEEETHPAVVRRTLSLASVLARWAYSLWPLQPARV